MEATKVIEATCNLDDETGEVLGYVMEQLLKAGALDVWTEPIYMKKNRPGVKLCFLATLDKKDALANIVLKETSALGLRYVVKDRIVLPREMVTVDTEYGSVRVKVATLPDGSKKFAPEYEDCRKLAEAKGVALKAVYTAVNKITKTK